MYLRVHACLLVCNDHLTIGCFARVWQFVYLPVDLSCSPYIEFQQLNLSLCAEWLTRCVLTETDNA